MSQSTTDGQSTQTPVQCSQNDTYDRAYHEGLRLNYPDRQDEMNTENETNPANEMVPESTDNSFVEATPPISGASPAQPSARIFNRTFTEEEKKKIKDDINEMNQRFIQHGYEAFVHKKMHLIFKVYPFDLE